MSHSETAPTRPGRSALVALFFVVLLDLIGFGIVIPFLPLFAKHFGADGFTVGLLMASYSLMQFLISPVWGRLSDRYGRRKILLGTMFGAVVANVITGMAPSLTVLFLGRLLSGTFAANISTAYALVTDITSTENRAKGMGLLGAAMGLGFTIGPAIGGWLSTYGFGIPMYFAAVLTAFNIVYAWKALPHVKPTQSSESPLRFADIANYLRRPRIGVPIFVFFLFNLAVTQMEVIIVMYLESTFGLQTKSIGMLFLLAGVVMVIVQGGLIGRLSKTFGEIRLTFVSALLGAGGLLFLGRADTVPLFVLGLVALSLGRGVLHPSLSTLTSKGTDQDNRGAVMGLFHSMGSLARILGPVIAGSLYDKVSHFAPFVAGSALLLATAGAIRAYPRHS